MDEITLQIRRVQLFVATSGLTKTRIASMANVPLTTLIGMEKPEWNPRSTTLRALVGAINKYEIGEARRKANPKRRQHVEAAA